jgi:hypothetical protein
MKLLLASFFTTLIASILGLVVCGPELGGVFALIAVAALLTPVFSTDKEFAESGVFLGVAIPAASLLVRDTLDGRQLMQLTLLLAAFTAALAALTRLLIALRFSPTLASSLVIVATIAWLAWPIWISPWVTADLANMFVPVHPLLAINGATPQLGYWQQSRLMYHLTSLGPDVHAPPPDTAAAAIIVHAVIAVLAIIPGVAWRLLFSRRAAAAAG